MTPFDNWVIPDYKGKGTNCTGFAMIDKETPLPALLYYYSNEEVRRLKPGDIVRIHMRSNPRDMDVGKVLITGTLYEYVRGSNDPLYIPYTDHMLMPNGKMSGGELPNDCLYVEINKQHLTRFPDNPQPMGMSWKEFMESVKHDGRLTVHFRWRDSDVITRQIRRIDAMRSKG